MSKRYWVWSFVLVWLWAGSTHAASFNTLRNQARALYREGKTFALQKQYAQANEKYAQALALVRKAKKVTRRKREKELLHHSEASFLLIIGRTHHLASQFPLARTFYLRCIGMKPPPKVELQARRFLQMLPQPLGKMVVLRINATPLHASISLHNARGEGRFGRIPFTARVKAGIYQIEITAAGYLSRKETLRLKPGTRVLRSYKLEAKGPKARKKPKNVVIQRKAPPAPKKGGWRAPLTWACVGLAGISLVTGAVLFGASSRAFDEATLLRTSLTRFPTTQQSEKFYADADRGGSLQGGGIAMIIIAGVAGAGALAFGLSGGQKTPASQAPAPPNARTSRVLWRP